MIGSGLRSVEDAIAKAPPHSASTGSIGTRVAIAAGIAIAEAAAVSYAFDLDRSAATSFDWWTLIKQAALVLVCAVPAFFLIAAGRWRELVGIGSSVTRRPDFAHALALNALLFIAVVAASKAISGTMPADGLPLAVTAGYALLLAALAGSLAWLTAPGRAWLALLRGFHMELLIALLIAVLAVALAFAAQAGWRHLAWLTLWLSHGLLQVFAPGARIDPASAMLGLGTFEVRIDEACSGYEGIGLVVTFMALYCWAFRSTLRFPNALLLLPLGVAAIWLLNSARIAALVGIGAHVSPDIAIRGFHSQAGWIAFLLVAGAIMWLAPRAAFFAKDDTLGHADPRVEHRTATAYLAPFMALMAVGILSAAMAPHETWLYPVKVVAVGACLWAFRDAYRTLDIKTGWAAWAAGAVVGIAWLASAPTPTTEPPLAAWLATAGPQYALIWLIFRGIGAILIVPIAEELAFRGYFHRWLIDADTRSVHVGQFAWTAFLVTSITFGLLHERWLAGMFAGAVFAVVMYRSGRISDPIAAHMTANAVIFSWAVAMGDWRHL